MPPIIVKLGIIGARSFFSTLGKVAGSFKKAADAAVNFAAKIVKIGIIGSVVAGIVALGTAVKWLGSAMKDMARDAFNAATSFQVLQIRLEGLLARQFRLADSTLSVGDAYKKAGREVKGYLRWIQEIAVTTPFEVETLANVFSLAQAYSFTAREAQVLTLAIGNFTAGMGLSDNVMSKIIENFGQMRAAGKVTGTELRDLARGAFLPVAQILQRMAENLGIAAEDMDAFKKTSREGGVAVDEFFNAFIQIANDEFPDAMERMSKTWVGVMSNVKDFIKVVLGVNLLGPLVTRFAEIAANALEKLLSPAVRNTATQVGQFLLVAFNRLWDSVNNRLVPAIMSLLAAFGLVSPSANDLVGVIALVVNAVTSAIDAFATWAETTGVTLAASFKQLASNAVAWGANIVTQFAQGMINAATSALVAAMNFISGLLSYWMAPGSPPKFLPNIGLWGQGAFLEYLKGFTTANFSVLKSLQGPLQSALSILVNMGNIKAGKASSLFASFSESIAKFLSGAGGGAGLFSSLITELGVFGAELGELLRRQLALTAAVKALEEAEASLEAARKKESAAIAAVGELTEEYNALLRAGADPEVLAQKLAEINAAEEARALAIEQRKEEELAVEAAGSQIEFLREQVALQSEILSQMLAIQRAQVQPKGKGGAAPDPIGQIGFPGLDIPDEGFGRSEGKMRKNFSSMFDELGAMLKKKITEFWQESVVGPLTEGFDEIQRLFDAKVAELLAPFDEMMTRWAAIWQQIEDIALLAATIIGEGWDAFILQISEGWEYFKGKLEDTGISADDVGMKIARLWNALLFLGAIVVLVAALFISGVLRTFGWIIKWGLIIAGFLLTSKEDMWAWVLDWLVRIAEWQNEILAKFVQWAVDTNAVFVNWVIEVLKALTKWARDIKEKIATALEELLTAVGEWVIEYIKPWNDLAVDMLTAGRNAIQGLWDGMLEKIGPLLKWLGEQAALALALWKTIWGEESPSKEFSKIGKNAMIGLKLGMQGEAPSVLKASSSIASGALAVAHPDVMSRGGGDSNFSMRVDSINNGMDEAALEAMVRRVIRRMD